MLELERCGAGLEHQRARQCARLRLPVDRQFERRRQGVVACGDVVERAGRVTDAEVLSRSELQRLQAAGEEDAHARDRRSAECRAGKVVEDDLRVTRALLRIPVRPVLAEADTVSPAVTGDDEGRGSDRRGVGHACGRRRSGAEQENGDE